MKMNQDKRDYSICIGNIVLQGGNRRLLSVDTGIFYGTLYQYGKPLADARGVFCGNGMFPAGDTAYQIRSGNGGNYPDHPSDRMGR